MALLRKILNTGKVSCLELNSYINLKRLRRKKYKIDKVNIGFLVSEPETWDKSEPVYEELCRLEFVNVELLVIPSFDSELEIGDSYGYEYDYFSGLYQNVYKAVSELDGSVVDTKKYDYLFYQDPYNIHIPKGLKSFETSKYSKLCYIPYGMIYFYHIGMNRDFFRDLYFYFVDSSELKECYLKRFKRYPGFKYQFFEFCGYPVIEKYLKDKFIFENKKVMWTPRWSYDPVIGGSHFLEYKEKFLNFKEMFPMYDLIIRPHPMTFANMIKEGYMTEEEVKEYKQSVLEKGIKLDEGNTIEEAFKEADILVTDFSSTNIMFFLTEKPIIYCPFFTKGDSIYDKLQEGMYIANNWTDISKFLEQLGEGNDYLKETRLRIKEDLFGDYPEAAKEIVNCIIRDYKNNCVFGSEGEKV